MIERPERSAIRRLSELLLQPPPEPLDIVTFAEQHLNLQLFPRQKTLLRLITLDLEHMGEYDRRVIDGWRTSFGDGPETLGVSPDVWERIRILRERGFEHFREVLLLIGRRGGKNFLASVVAAYKVYRLLLLGCPQRVMGIHASAVLTVTVAATNLAQSKGVAFGTLQQIILGAPAFAGKIAFSGAEEVRILTPFDEMRVPELRAKGVPPKEMGSIRVSAVSSNPAASRGSAGVVQIYDELAHTASVGERSGEELYVALTPSLDQSKKHAIILDTTSPWSKQGQAWKTYLDALATEEDGSPSHPQLLVAQLTSWDPYLDYDDPVATGGVDLPEPPQVWSELLADEERRDPQRFRVERRSQWQEVIDAFFTREVVDRIFEPYCRSCGRSLPAEAWESSPSCPLCSADDGAEMPVTRSAGIAMHIYRAHADAAAVRDDFAFCIGHLEWFTESTGEEVPHVVIDHLRRWSPSDFPDHELPYDEIEAEIVDLLRHFPMTEIISFDQYGAFATMRSMARALESARHRARVRQYVHTSSSNRERAEIVKEAAALNRIHAPRDAWGRNGTSQLEAELRALQVRNGRVVAPTTGPVRTDDSWTAFSVVAAELLRRAHPPAWRQKIRRVRLETGLQGGYVADGRSPTPSPREVLREHANAARFRRWPGHAGRYPRPRR